MPKIELAFIGMVYESIIIIIASIILVLIFKKYLEKKHRLTLILFVIFTLFGASLVFSWFAKVIFLFAGLDYVDDAEVADPLTLESFFIMRIINFRFTFIFLTLGCAFNYYMRIKLFEEGYNQRERLFIFTFGVFTILYQIIFFIKNNTILEILAFSLIAIYMAVTFLPFMSRCFKSYKAVDNIVFKRGFLSLAIMNLAVSFILVFQLIDRLFILLLDSPGYTPFYFLGFLCAIIGYFGAYFGYIRPKSRNV